MINLDLSAQPLAQMTPYDGPVTFCIGYDQKNSSEVHVSSGEEDVLSWSTSGATIFAERPSPPSFDFWRANSVYVVPRKGTYEINLSFIKNWVQEGTVDDVFLYCNRQMAGTDATKRLFRCWNGQVNHKEDRVAVSRTIIVELDHLDFIFVSVFSEGGKKRVISDATFSIKWLHDDPR